MPQPQGLDKWRRRHWARLQTPDRLLFIIPRAGGSAAIKGRGGRPFSTFYYLISYNAVRVCEIYPESHYFQTNVSYEIGMEELADSEHDSGGGRDRYRIVALFDTCTCALTVSYSSAANVYCNVVEIVKHEAFIY